VASALHPPGRPSIVSATIIFTPLVLGLFAQYFPRRWLAALGLAANLVVLVVAICLSFWGFFTAKFAEAIIGVTIMLCFSSPYLLNVAALWPIVYRWR
jgi:hypothetical protein